MRCFASARDAPAMAELERCESDPRTRRRIVARVRMAAFEADHKRLGRGVGVGADENNAAKETLEREVP
ncbi:MAG: hypothetical protein OXU20_20565 [Myxococcales bacterium]|nr:hypothetical protein [Myxococcales bacterium]